MKTISRSVPPRFPMLPRRLAACALEHRTSQSIHGAGSPLEGGAPRAARPRRTHPAPPRGAGASWGCAAPGGPEHPWTGMQISAGWGSGDKLRYVTVQPNLVAEARADPVVDRGRHRHPVRYLRIRNDPVHADTSVRRGTVATSSPPCALSSAPALVPSAIPAEGKRYPCTECGDLGVEPVMCLRRRGRMLAGICPPPVSAVQTRCR